MVPVVMKILQPSLMAIPNFDEYGDPFWRDEYENPQELAEHEAAMYSPREMGTLLLWIAGGGSQHRQVTFIQASWTGEDTIR